MPSNRHSYRDLHKTKKHLSHKSVQFFIIDDDIITSDNILSNQQIQPTAKSAAADHIDNLTAIASSLSPAVEFRFAPLETNVST